MPDKKKKSKSKSTKSKGEIYVKHFRDKCIGCGMCTLLCPQNWELSEDDGKASLKGSEKMKNFYKGKIDPADHDANKQAEEFCPVDIIQVED